MTAVDQPRTGDWIALYGSLMRGLGGLESLGIRHRLRYAGPCTCRGQLFDLGSYPGLRPGGGRVVGELHALLDPTVIEILDEFEGYDATRRERSLYLRERVALIEPEETSAWIYVFNSVPDASATISSGDWRAHLATREAP